MTEQTKQGFWSKQKWFRGLVMLLFWLVLQIVLFIMGIVILVQFVGMLLTREMPRLKSFSSSLSIYIWQILQFLGFATESRPFPFSDWPLADEIDSGAKPAEEHPSDEDETN